MIKEKAEYAEMWKTGYKKEKPKLDIKKRDCMMCYQPFQSEGIHNRICNLCKGTEEWEMGNDYSFMQQ